MQRTQDDDDALFALALHHVLEMEGGFGEDAYDPGGPTNLGITLAVFARWRGADLTADTYASLKAQLRGLTRDEAGRIYRANYWNAASCPSLPAPLAVFHFDCAVNQGVLAAVRFLQRALDVEVDGAAGPVTRAAAAQSDPGATLAAYAEARRAHYRSLSTFWRFGRGWLSRVDAALKLATAVAAEPRFRNSPATQPTEPPMSNSSPTPQSQVPAAKWWGNSVTIWGVVITALSTVLPTVAPIFGLNLTEELIQQLGAGVVQLAQAASGVIGTGLAIWGRSRATLPLTTNPPQ